MAESIIIDRSVEQIRQWLQDWLDVEAELSASGVQPMQLEGQRFLHWLTPANGTARIVYEKLAPEMTKLYQPKSGLKKSGDEKHLANVWKALSKLGEKSDLQGDIDIVVRGWQQGLKQAIVARQLSGMSTDRDVRRLFKTAEHLGRIPKGSRWLDNPQVD